MTRGDIAWYLRWARCRSHLGKRRGEDVHETETRRGTYQPHPERLQLVLGWGVIVSIRQFNFVALTTVKRYARHRIEFGHVADKVHLVCPNGAHAHDELGGNVEDGEEYDWEVVGHEHGSRPVTVEEHVPCAKLE